MNKYLHLHVIFPLLLCCASCAKLQPGAPSENALLDGPVEGLTPEQRQRFLAGDVAFNDDIFTAATGLGPQFVATSCGSCHAGDGKGHPFSTLVRYGQTDSTGNQFLHLGGPQLQNRAIPGYEPEQLPPGATFSRFTPPANTGLGYLELVPDQEIMAMADPFDANGDGISGVPGLGHLPAYSVPRAGSIPQNGKYIFRFGKKSGAYDLLHQTVNAYSQDMGIASAYAPLDIYSNLPIEPEVSSQKVNDLVFYLQTLKAPLPRETDNDEVKWGNQLFMQTGCETCHRQTLHTGPSPVAALSNTEFHPYTDLLLHDMGPQLDDGYTEGSALTAEWRTPALWGLGLSPNSQGGQYFLLHDGRAHSIQEAILLHGGEAQASRNAYVQLTETEKKALIRFLQSL